MTLDRNGVILVLRRLGVPGFTALTILAGSAWTEWISAPAIAIETAEIHAQALAERERKAVAQPLDSAQEMLAAIQSRLPDDRQSNATLASLLQAAKAQGLTVDAVQFQTELSGVPGVVRHHMQVPVNGHYEALREWVSTILREHPSVTLDSLDIKRKDAARDELQAQVTMSLWADTTRYPSFKSKTGHVD